MKRTAVTDTANPKAKPTNKPVNPKTSSAFGGWAFELSIVTVSARPAIAASQQQLTLFGVQSIVKFTPRPNFWNAITMALAL